MILIDFSAIVFASLHTDLKDGATPNKDFIRHICLNTLRAYNKKFRADYGEMVICYDSKSWREKVFPEYKWVRRNTRSDDGNNWDEIYKLFNEIQIEITENMPYKTVQGLGAEGDDVISVLGIDANEIVLVVSNDKDFPQLMKYRHIKQYRPCVKAMNEVDDPARFLFDMFLTGDKDDGIPNIKCGNDFFKQQVLDKQNGEKPKRAPSITQKFKDEMYDLYSGNPQDFYDYLKENEMLTNYKRNVLLIDLVNEGRIPEVVVNNIRIAFKNAKNNSDIKMIRYFQKHRLLMLSQCLEDFKVGKYKPALF